jgi:hypothetical protein
LCIAANPKTIDVPQPKGPILPEGSLIEKIEHGRHTDMVDNRHYVKHRGNTRELRKH